MTALTLFALFRRCPGVNRRQLVALGGLDPIEVHSGSSVRGKPDAVARIAPARKLLPLAHAIYRGGEPFRTTAGEAT